jgi:hypothetical protein
MATAMHVGKPYRADGDVCRAWYNALSGLAAHRGQHNPGLRPGLSHFAPSELSDFAVAGLAVTTKLAVARERLAASGPVLDR